MRYCSILILKQAREKEEYILLFATVSRQSDKKKQMPEVALYQ